MEENNCINCGAKATIQHHVMVLYDLVASMEEKNKNIFLDKV